MDEDRKIDGVQPESVLDRIYLDDAPLTRAALEAHPSLCPRFHSSVPPGWDAEVARAILELAKLSTSTGVEIKVAQIKSKLASLRIYLSLAEDSVGPLEVAGATPISTHIRSSARPGSVRDRASVIVDAAADRCAVRCERCGADATMVNKRGWLVIACPTHARSDPDDSR